MADNSKVDGSPSEAGRQVGLAMQGGSFPVSVRTEAIRVDLAIVVRDGDLKLTGAVYFATDDEIWDKPIFLGLFKRKHRSTYGFRGGQLRVELVNATAPIADRFGTPLEARAEFEAGSATGRSTEFGGEFGGEYSTGPKAGAKISGKRTWSSTSTERVVTHPPTVVTKGSDREPAWEFESYSPMPLRGHAPDHGIDLAKLLAIGPDVAAQATFLIDAADVACAETHPPGSANPKASAVLKQAFPKYLLKKWQAKGLEKISVSTTRAFFSSRHDGTGTGVAGDRP